MSNLVRLFALAAFAIGICHAFAASDPNVCATLANVVSVQQDRFDQAKAALEGIDGICSGDSNPKACAESIKNEYADAEIALNNARTNFKKAGCETDQ